MTASSPGPSGTPPRPTTLGDRVTWWLCSATALALVAGGLAGAVVLLYRGVTALARAVHG